MRERLKLHVAEACVIGVCVIFLLSIEYDDLIKRKGRWARR